MLHGLVDDRVVGLKQSSVKHALALLAAGLLLGGCGLRGPLVMPKKDVLPSLAESTQVETTAPASSGQGKPEDAAPKPHKEFILDSLLR